MFTLFIGGQRMTFVLDPMSVPAILKAEHLRFGPIADEVVAKGFGLATVRELADIEDLERTAKVYLKGSHLRPLTARMEQELRRFLPARPGRVFATNMIALAPRCAIMVQVRSSHAHARRVG
ncbi:MAG: hypothetical protein AAGF11_36225 [Myxococcota bacterium]